MVGVEPIDEEVNDEWQRFSARLLDLEGETGQRLGKLIVGAAAIEKVGKDRRDRFKPSPVGQIIDGLGDAALVSSDASGKFLDR